MTRKHFVAATAGHVDHGKSALVKALTGTDPDRLPEEKAREITIDLGFAHLELPGDGDRGSTVSLSIVDVPGHEDFIRNMIAGLGSIDLALLVVAADDGWMPQTEEHLQILSYLGVKRMAVAMNKADIGDPVTTKTQIRQQLQNTRFADAPIIATAARSGEGIGQLKQTLGSSLAAATPQPDIGKTRLLVDRAFNLPGIGPVVTGTLSCGTISTGEFVYIQPGNFKTRVRSLQTHRTSVSLAEPGMRTGVNLAEAPKNSSNDSGLRRGCVLTTNEYEASTIIDVVVEKSGRLPISHPAARPLKSGTPIYLHHGTARIGGILVLAGEKALHPGETAVGQLRLASPIVAFIGDRFVVRDRSEQHTIAGGTILDLNTLTRSFRSVNHQRLLADRSADRYNPEVYILSELSERGPVRVDALLKNSNFSGNEIDLAINRLDQSGKIVIRDQIAAEARSWRGLRQGAITAIEHAHHTNSQQKGLELNELRASLPNCPAELAEAVINDLCKNGFIRTGSVIASASHRPTLPAPLETAAKQILAVLGEKPLDPPGRSAIAREVRAHQALRYLVEQGEVVELGPELVIGAEAFAKAKQIVVATISKSGAATVSELRAALLTSRRIAVPLLERLDRERVTRRLGDRRVLFSSATDPMRAPAV